MLVCHCHRVNDRVIREAARAGARSCDDVGDEWRIGARFQLSSGSLYYPIVGSTFERSTLGAVNA